MTRSFRDPELERKVDEFMDVMRVAVREAQAENRRLGIPNVYCINGQVVYELPSGQFAFIPPAGWGANCAVDGNDRSKSPREGM